jgi:hypothetical protein
MTKRQVVFYKAKTALPSDIIAKVVFSYQEIPKLLFFVFLEFWRIFLLKNFHFNFLESF